jgi:selenocysteine lyase/cysteine desulfurase
MEDTWVRRDLPVLDTIVTLLDKPGTFAVSVAEIAGHTGLDPHEVDRAIEAMSGAYISKYQRTMSGGDPSGWYVTKVTSAARRAVGQWPTAQSLAITVVDGVTAAADHAQDEPDAQRRSILRKIGDAVGGTGRDVAVDVVTKAIEHKFGI